MKLIYRVRQAKDNRTQRCKRMLITYALQPVGIAVFSSRTLFRRRGKGTQQGLVYFILRQCEQRVNTETYLTLAAFAEDGNITVSDRAQLQRVPAADSLCSPLAEAPQLWKISAFQTVILCIKAAPNHERNPCHGSAGEEADRPPEPDYTLDFV